MLLLMLLRIEFFCMEWWRFFETCCRSGCGH